MTEQTPEPTSADPSASVAADPTAPSTATDVSAPADTWSESPAPTEAVSAPVDPSATVSADAGTPASATELVAAPAATPETPADESAEPQTTDEQTAAVLAGTQSDASTDANGEKIPEPSTEPANVDPQETRTVVLDEDGSDGAFIHGNLTIGTQPLDVFAGDLPSILLAAEQQGRKVKVVESVTETVEVEA